MTVKAELVLQCRRRSERRGSRVLATFGRGFYVLDDYTPLREITAQTLTEEARLFPLVTADGATTVQEFARAFDLKKDR